MGKNVLARQAGDDYQACFFWLKASSLNHRHSKTSKVAWEVESTFGFDDVVVSYNPFKIDGANQVIEECFQVKFHVDHKRGFTWEAMMEPEFIGNKTESILQRLYKNYENDPDKFKKSRYHIINTWGIDHSNELKDLLNAAGGIRLSVLSQGGINSKYGKIRESWKSHLGITDDVEFLTVLSSLRINHSYDSEERLKENLNVHLGLAGLRPMPADKMASKYEDLIRKLHRSGKNVFTKEEILAICKAEDLLDEIMQDPDDDFVIGVRSFQKGAESLELEVSSMSCFLHCFSGRFLLEEYADMVYIGQELTRLAKEALDSRKKVRVHLDSHLSLSLLLGYNMDSKYSGIDITIVQKTFSGKLLWRADAQKVREYKEALWTESEIEFSNMPGDLSVTISVTHDIRDDVYAFVRNQLPDVSRGINFLITPQVGGSSIKDANHIIAALEQMIGSIRSKMRAVQPSRLHLFIAAPNALAFYLGQRIKPLGPVALYEFDFERHRSGGYHKIINIP